MGHCKSEGFSHSLKGSLGTMEAFFSDGVFEGQGITGGALHPRDFICCCIRYQGSVSLGNIEPCATDQKSKNQKSMAVKEREKNVMGCITTLPCPTRAFEVS